MNANYDINTRSTGLDIREFMLQHTYKCAFSEGQIRCNQFHFATKRQIFRSDYCQCYNIIKQTRFARRPRRLISVYYTQLRMIFQHAWNTQVRFCHVLLQYLLFLPSSDRVFIIASGVSVLVLALTRPYLVVGQSVSYLKHSSS